tara:strand:- start:2230 stop:2424 length:195 start_codon:yes stop_codon:yes gene_type:complete
MKTYEITVKTYITGVHSACLGYATYDLEVEAEDGTEAKWLALQVADPESDRHSCVVDINELEGI